MNILEMEDMVKGMPDQILMQEASAPSGRIPQFLALSEVKRRQEMRQRFQAQAAPDQTVKDQILQGIGAVPQGPQGGPPMVPPGAPPMGPPPGPQGAPVMAYGGGMMPYRMYGGGAVPYRMQAGQTVPKGIDFTKMSNEQLEMLFQGDDRSLAQAALRERLRRSDYQTPSEFGEQILSGMGEISKRLLAPATGQRVDEFNLNISGGPPSYMTDESGRIRRGEVTGGIAGTRFFTSNRPTGSAAVADVAAPAISATPAAPATAANAPVDFAASVASQEDPFNFLNVANRLNQERFSNIMGGATAAPVAASVASPVAAPPSDAGVVPPAGGAAGAGTGQRQPGLGGMPPELRELLKPSVRSPEVQSAIDMLNAQLQAGLPPSVDLQKFIESAEKRATEARANARQVALANVLTNLGVGLMTGDAASGLKAAQASAATALKEGRLEERQATSAAEQLALQQAQQKRQEVLDTMKFKSDAVNSIATLASGEEKADRTARLQAAQLLVTWQGNRDRLIESMKTQGASDTRINKQLEIAAVQSATDLIEKQLQNGELTGTPDEIAAITRRLAQVLMGSQPTASSYTEDLAPTGESFKVGNYTVQPVAKAGR